MAPQTSARALKVPPIMPNREQAFTCEALREVSMFLCLYATTRNMWLTTVEFDLISFLFLAFYLRLTRRCRRRLVGRLVGYRDAR